MIKDLVYRYKIEEKTHWIEHCIFDSSFSLNSAMALGFIFVSYHFVNLSNGVLRYKQVGRKRTLKVKTNKKGSYVMFHKRRYYLEEA